MTTFTSDQWDERFTIVEHEQYGTVRPFTEGAIFNVSLTNVWTILDCEGLWIVPGKRRVNRFGYVVTEESWTAADYTDEWEWWN